MKVKRIISLTLVLSMVLTLFSTIVLPANSVKAESYNSVEAAFAGNGYGQSRKFIAIIAAPVEDSIAISSVEDLKKIGAPGGYALDKDYHLTANIDLAGEEWEPIGTKTDPFTGTFDGQGYVISNMKITGERESAGLFGYVGGVYYNGQLGPYKYTPNFKNIGLEDVNIDVSFDTQSYAGGIFGKNHRGEVTVDNCYVTGQIKSGSMNSYVGGLAGYTQGENPTGRMTIKDSYNGAVVDAIGESFDGEGYTDLGVPLSVVEAGSSSAGGIVGWGADVYAVTNCHNIGKVTSDSTGAASAGGIAGFGFIYECDQVSLCSNRGEVKAVSDDAPSNTGQRTNYSYAGGIVGYDSPNERITTITRCYNEGNVSAEINTDNTEIEIFAGGIGGRLNNQTISDCYNKGTISAKNVGNTSGYAAGICGRVSKNSNVRRTYNTGTISGAKKGAIAGLSIKGSVIRSNFYQFGSATKGVAEGEGEDGTVALSIGQMKDEKSFTGYNFSKIWGFKPDENDDMPIFQESYPGFTYTPTGEVPGAGYDFLAEIEEPKEGSYPISSVEELQQIGKEDGLPLTWDYHLTTNLDMTGVTWVPINGFRGVFDGHGYAIHNLEIVGAYNNAGLFGKIELDYENTHRPVLKNIALENVYINTVTTNYQANYVGGLLGYNDRAYVSISNCYVTGEISSSGYTVQTGGLVGYNHSEGSDMFSISDCQNYADVTSSGTGSAGGILAAAGYAETIENCHNYGKISATSTRGDFCAAGGVIANLYKGNVINKCSNVGDVTALSTSENSVYTGGIVAYTHSDSEGVTLSNCYNTGYISATLNKLTSNTSGEMYSGGISGRAIGLNIEDSFNTGAISAIHNFNIIGASGGIAGVLKDGSIRKSYSTGNISASEYVGGIIGEIFGYGFTRNTYWNSDAEFYKNNTVLQLSEKKGVGSGEDTTSSKTAAQLKQEATFTGFEFDEIWGLQPDDNSDYPILRAFNPDLDYISTTSSATPIKSFIEEDFDSPKEGSKPIETREDLENIRNDLTGSYHLVADIDMTGIDWIPIGDNSTNSNSSRFTGTLDGQGHVITGLEVMTLEKNASTGYSGLFGYVGGTANIRNLGLENVFISNSSWTPFAGGIFGTSPNSTDLSVENCYVTGEIKSTSGGYVGGIAGNIYGNSSYVTNCYNSAKVTSSFGTGISYAGGITGRQGYGKIAGCYNKGNISMSQVIGESTAGGIAGIITQNAGIINSYNKGKVSISSKTSGYAGGISGFVSEGQCNISACYNAEEVSANTISTVNSVKVEAGGIAGQNKGIINDCFNSSNIIVYASSTNANAGGIVGEGYSESVVSKCYSSGNITSGTNLGGIAGLVNNNSSVEDSYWNKEATFKVGSNVLPEATRKGIGSGIGSVVGLTITQMKNQSSFETFDFNDIWSIKADENDGFPILQTKKCMYTVGVSRDIAGQNQTKEILGSWSKGDTVSVVAPEVSNYYRFKEWISPDVTFTNKNDVATTFTMPAKNISLFATYELIPSHTLTLINAGYGSTYREGQEVSISASELYGKAFKEWISDNADVQFADKTSRTTTFIMPNKDVTVEAVFEDILYTITVYGGTASLTTAKVGDLVTITSNVPETDKSFSHWKTGTATLSNAYAAVTTFTMPNRNVTIDAVYQDKVKEYQAAPSAPILSGKTSTSVTLKEIVGAEYQCNSGAWQDSPVFSGLTPNTYYTFYARMKETQIHTASANSYGLSVMTDKEYQAAPSAPILSGKTSTSVTLNYIEGAEYQCNSGEWQDSPVFSGLTPNTNYIFNVRMKETQTHNASAISDGLSVMTDKVVQAAPSKPILSSKTSTSVTLKKIVEAEYKCKSGAWQDSPVFSGLKPNTTYIFYARMKETQTHKVSANSDGLSVKTDKVVKSNIRKKALTPVISKQPKSKTLKLRSKCALSVKVKVKYGKLSYQWQISTKKNGKFENIAGAAAKKSTYKISAKKKDTYYYRCIITNTDKNAITKKSDKTSKTVTIKVK